MVVPKETLVCVYWYKHKDGHVVLDYLNVVALVIQKDSDGSDIEPYVVRQGEILSAWKAGDYLGVFSLDQLDKEQKSLKKHAQYLANWHKEIEKEVDADMGNLNYEPEFN